MGDWYPGVQVLADAEENLRSAEGNECSEEKLGSCENRRSWVLLS
jgi:hypothetical protein